MSAQDDLLGREEEGYPLAGVVRYLYSRSEYEELEREKEALEERLQQLETKLRSRRPWWGKLRALLPGGKGA